jgi:hypothetical protein
MRRHSRDSRGDGLRLYARRGRLSGVVNHSGCGKATRAEMTNPHSIRLRDRLLALSPIGVFCLAAVLVQWGYEPYRTLSAGLAYYAGYAYARLNKP